MEINLLDLFSGIGGFHLGLERAGFKVNAYNSEIDKYAIDVYKHNFKNSTYVGSVTDVRAEQLPRIDAITFGSPCQDFSLAGKRRGMGGDRSSLITEAIRLIDECRPSFFIWENVKGTFSSNNGADFWAIIQAFANIGGYRLEWQLLNTKWFLPQNRERIYLVGYLTEGSGGEVFPIRESSKQIKVKIKSATKRGYEEATQGDSINFSVPNSKTRRGRVGKRVAQTLDTKCEQAVMQLNNCKKSGGKQPYQQDRVYSDKGISPCLMRDKSDLIIKEEYRNSNQGSIRKLTPIECERLQGFPDNWSKYGDDGEISDTQRYKMCGNAVTVDVVEAVAKQIKQLYGQKAN